MFLLFVLVLVLVCCGHTFSFRSFLAHQDRNSIAGSIPTEIGLLTSLTSWSFCKCCSCSCNTDMLLYSTRHNRTSSICRYGSSCCFALLCLFVLLMWLLLVRPHLFLFLRLELHTFVDTYIDDNDLTGQIPSEIAQLTRLTSLNLGTKMRYGLLFQCVVAVSGSFVLCVFVLHDSL